MKPPIYFPIAHPLYMESVRSVWKYFEEKGHICVNTYNGQPIMIGSDAGDYCNAELKFNLNHGFGSKNTYWGARDGKREKGIIQLVPSRWYQNMLARYGVSSEIVGMPRLDKAVKLLREDSGICLYAPTCHSSVTSVRMVEDKIYGITGYTPEVRLHPQLQVQIPEIKYWYPNWIKHREAGELVAEAEVVICDYATTALDAVVLNKPVIVLEPKDYRTNSYFNKNNAEVVFDGAYYKAYCWEDAEKHLHNLRNGVDPLRLIREQMGPMICSYLGCATKRVYEVVGEKWRERK